MNAAPVPRRWKKWSIAALGVLAALAMVVVAALAVLESPSGKRALIQYVSARTGRHIQVDGPLEVHLLSSSPSLTAERVTIGNPPWTPPGTMAEIGKLSLVFDVALPLRGSSIRRLEMTSAKLNLARDAAGRANWQTRPPGNPRREHGFLVRSLSMPGAHVELSDARRHLKFTGTVDAGDRAADRAPDRSAGRAADRTGSAPLLRISGNGQLNGRPARFTVDAAPLSTARYDKPYEFSFVEHSGDSKLTASGKLLQPFDPGMVDASFEATGATLHDLVYLVGMALPNSAPFTLSGKIARRGPQSTFNEISARFGKSDVRGSVVMHTVNGRPQFNADLRSSRLRLSDIGRHEADGSAAPVSSNKLLLPDTQLPFAGLRNKDWVVRYHADSIEGRELSLNAFAADATLNRGILVAPAFKATFRDAQLAGNLKIDATDDSPKTDLDLKVSGLELSRFSPKGVAQPPFGGPLHVRAQLTGRGNSVHEFAESANGVVVALLPHGSMRASLAEVTGISLRGLGLKLTGSQQETPIRCAIASFHAKDGALSAQQVMIDTEPVLINGTGAIRMDSEALDFTLHGEPKKMQLVRIRSPLYMRGSLKHPEFSVNTGRLVAQAGAAAALGVVLTPVAALIAFADPGHAENADCSGKLVATSMPRDRKTAKGVTESAKRTPRSQGEN